MGFITGIDISAIDSPDAMCRAVLAVFLDVLEPGYAVLRADSDPDDSDRDGPIELSGASFIVFDRSRGSDWRVTVTGAEGPRPVQLGEDKRKLLALADRVGVAQAVALLSGDVPTVEDRYLLRIIQALELSREQVVRRLANSAADGAGAPDVRLAVQAEGEPADDDEPAADD